MATGALRGRTRPPVWSTRIWTRSSRLNSTASSHGTSCGGCGVKGAGTMAVLRGSTLPRVSMRIWPSWTASSHGTSCLVEAELDKLLVGRPVWLWGCGVKEAVATAVLQGSTRPRVSTRSYRLSSTASSRMSCLVLGWRGWWRRRGSRRGCRRGA